MRSLFRFLKLFVVAVVIMFVAGMVYVAYTGYESSKPELPVTITYRESLVGEGYVAQFRNESDRHLRVEVSIISATDGRTKIRDILEIRPGQTYEVGWIEGWRFVSGDRIVVSHSGYRTQRGTIP